MIHLLKSLSRLLICNLPNRALLLPEKECPVIFTNVNPFKRYSLWPEGTFFNSLSIIDNDEKVSYGTSTAKEKCALNPYYKCKKKGVPLTELCRDSDCEWLVKNERFLNCTWVACNHGPFTLEEVGAMMGVTRERIRQIEAKALKRLQQKKRKEQLRDFSNERDKDSKSKPDE